jgi:hypothetical protein
MKDAVDTVELLPGDGGGTNWEFALETAATLQPDVVLLLTDGQPTAHGDPYSSVGVVDDKTDPSAAVTAAVLAADSMRASGVRLVGLGIGLTPNFIANLAEVTGPTPDDDYYETGSDASGLLSRLYDVASKSCGIPVAALPQPVGGTIPVAAIVGIVVALALLAVLGGYLLSKRKSAAVATTIKSSKLPDPTIQRAYVPPRSLLQNTPPERPPNPPARTARHLSTARLHPDDPPLADRGTQQD